MCHWTWTSSKKLFSRSGSFSLKLNYFSSRFIFWLFMWLVAELKLRLHFLPGIFNLPHNDISHHLNFPVSRDVSYHVNLQSSPTISFMYVLTPNPGSKFFKDKVYAFFIFLVCKCTLDNKAILKRYCKLGKPTLPTLYYQIMLPRWINTVI